MPLIVNGSKLVRKEIENMLKEICAGAKVDENTGKATLSTTTVTGAKSGCKCLISIINSKRTVKINPISGPDKPLPPPRQDKKMKDYGGGMTSPDCEYGAWGVPLDGEKGSDVDVFIDITDNNGNGYRLDESPMKVPLWLILSHELTDGHAYHCTAGTLKVSHTGSENQAIEAENEHRKEHNIEPRKLLPPKYDGDGN